jgi:peptide-methionine (S)-S-oxide reductase
MEKAIFANGCFWCTEAVFQEVKGVTKVQSGYTGGTVPNPTYEQVAGGNTGHAESLKIEFDPSIITYEDLLFIFWRTHNPTTLNQQGADVGTQYRSAIFYTNEEQKKLAEKSKSEAQELFDDPIVTEIVPASEFYPAEKYHENYYNDNRNAPYCRIVIDPKMQKLRKELGKFLK